MTKSSGKSQPVKLDHGVIDYMKDDEGRPVYTVPVAGLEQHPLGKLFPLDTDDKLDELAADIKERGQLDPIVLAAVHGEATWHGTREPERGLFFVERRNMKRCLIFSRRIARFPWGCFYANSIAISSYPV